MGKRVRKNKKISLSNKTAAALFSDFSLQSNNLFLHCSRIPDVMVRIIKAREILKRYKIKPPAWMFGIMNKGEVFDSPVHFRLMSFLISLGLYNRLVRLKGSPGFLMGNSYALLVSAKIRTFEKSVIKIFCGQEMEQRPLRVYQKKKGTPVRFSLLHFSEDANSEAIQNITKKYQINHCILISPSVFDATKGMVPSHAAFKVRGLIEMDPKLAWFWPILKRGQLKSRKTLSHSFSLDTFFK
ncbi:MAG: hypothetical protein OXM55_01755 [Bdellovibrionales bacterium]|nr:hypothetical protein [Bdellovibrionales bacterium]